MTLEILARNWALLIASVFGGALLLFVLWRLWLQSPRGRLREVRKRLQIRIRALTRAERALRRGSRALASLEARAASISPSRLQAAREAVEDARALAKIAHDQVLIAENLVREVIVEEFPPRRHESLRRRYLRPDEERGKPFAG